MKLESLHITLGVTRLRKEMIWTPRSYYIIPLSLDSTKMTYIDRYGYFDIMFREEYDSWLWERWLPDKKADWSYLLRPKEPYMIYTGWDLIIENYY